ncbi:MAG: hypothetical protein KY458_10335 [Actinobacteria bacterium]|nr:hypothetical protein [Actinomycetota bacterium]
MVTYVLRVWIPDRPGALGAVASRIGAVRGDLVGIDILERGAGMAIDELVVDLPDNEGLVPLLVHEVSEVDGVAVEEVREVAGSSLADPRLAALETAALLVAQQSRQDLMGALVRRAASDFDAQWATLAGGEQSGVHAEVGECPPAAWLAAFVAGSRSVSGHPSGGPISGPHDIAWAALERAGLDLVVGRPGRPVRQRERQQLVALARIADLRWSELTEPAALRVHPGAG